MRMHSNDVIFKKSKKAEQKTNKRAILARDNSLEEK